MTTDTHARLVASLAHAHPEDTARSLEVLDSDEALEILAPLPDETVARVLDAIEPAVGARLMSQVEPARVREWLGDISPRQAAAILRKLGDAINDAVFAGMDEITAKRLRGLIQYEGDTAGGMMEPQVASLRLDHSVHEAIAALRNTPRQALYYLYVTDRRGRLQGVLNMRELLLADPKTPLASIVIRDVTTVPAEMDREDVAQIMREKRFLALPVVDAEHTLLGVVRHDQVLAAVQDEAFEDMQRMVGAGGDERAFSPVGHVIRKRLPWLTVNLVTAFMSAIVVGIFQDAIAAVTALAVLMPIVAGQGGNTGAQAMAVVMRGIVLGEVARGGVRRLLTKEVLAALLNSLVIAALTAGVVMLWDGRWGLGAVIAIAMVANMVAAGLFGAAIPLVLSALGRDPAQSSAIVLTTVTDVIGFGVFLGCAVAFMPVLVN